MSNPKCYVPLESDPDIFTHLIHDLGVSDTLQFVDVWSIHDEEQLEFIPRPILALIVVFPDNNTNDTVHLASRKTAVPGFTSRKSDESSSASALASGGGARAEGVLWFKQTIHNACGLYAILHAACNGVATEFIQPDSALDEVINTCRQLRPSDRAKVIEDSDQIRVAYARAAQQGSTDAPDATAEVDCHYVCFTKASGDSWWLLDGDRDGALESIDPATRSDGDVLDGAGRDLIQRFVEDASSSNDNSSNVGIMALVQT